MSKILVIEDDNNVRENILALLTYQNYDVECAIDGQEGLEKCKEKSFDLVLSDVMMPKMNGFELYSKIYDNPNGNEPAFVFLSAKTDRASIRKGMNLGAEDYLTKPFSAKELLNVIKRRIDKRDLNNGNKKVEKFKSDFISQVSHEIRTPLQAITSLLSKVDMSKDDTSNDDFETSEILSLVRSSGNRLTKTVESMVYAAELSNNIYEINKTDFDLYAEIILPLLENEFLAKMADKNLFLKITNPDEYYPVIADFESVKIIFENLISNAVKFTNTGTIKIALEKQENRIKVTIEDTGIGIDKDFMDRIFLPFSQETTGLTRTHEGNGLGLTLVSKFCDLNDFYFDIASKKNEGTKVTVKI